MNEMELNIGKRLKDLRASMGLKLEEVSDLTGVSKAMLSQIERGKTIPSVTVLWKLTKGLKVGFTFFLDETVETYDVKRMEEMDPVTDKDGLTLYPFYPFDSKSGLEIFMIHMLGKSQHTSLAHTRGLVEYITVIEGSLCLELADHTYELNKGESIKFSGDVKHVYINKGTGQLVFQNIILNAL